MEEGINKSTGVLVGIIFIAVMLAIFLLAFLFITNSFNTITLPNANQTVQVINESGYLRESGYTLMGSNIVIGEVIRQSNGEILTPGNYTLVGNKIYNNTELQC